MARETLSRKTSANPPSVTRPALPASFGTSVSSTATGSWGQVRTGTVSSEEHDKRFDGRKDVNVREYQQPTEHTVGGPSRTSDTTPASSI